MSRDVDCGTLNTCRSSSSSTDTPRPSAQPPSRPGQGFKARCDIGSAASTCLAGGHALWWRVQAEDAAAALAMLPLFVARRTVPIEVRDIEIP